MMFARWESGVTSEVSPSAKFNGGISTILSTRKVPIPSVSRYVSQSLSLLILYLSLLSTPIYLSLSPTYRLLLTLIQFSYSHKQK